ncbi:hypothetical protein KGQ19_01465 [Catenulispora sp. NL8]|uniref:Integrase n=1 Tax=Catenulispora pinistramenti TaxID=2705254 RepID=A0ABS5KGY5_9ACTN|nr:hypothetical protein [Catenulispora pinistramenti]MBS2545529.1 hypothetical protein [Catenulispora pinistramenti]
MDQTTTHGLLDGSSGMVVRRFSQDGTEHRDFDFGSLPCSEVLREALMKAFLRRTAPGTRVTSMAAMGHAFRIARQFADYLAGLRWPPREPSQLTAEHFDSFCAARLAASPKSMPNQVGDLRRLLACMDGINTTLTARMASERPSRLEAEPKHSYSRAEFKRIADAARADLRSAAKRIRGNREALRQFRERELAPSVCGDAGLLRRLELLDYVDRFGDVPRYAESPRPNWPSPPPLSWVQKHGSAPLVVSWLHLTIGEAASAAVLLAVMTGENPEVIVKVPAAHHRPDGFTGTPGTAVVDLLKLRRGRRAWMTLAMSDVPDWISIPDTPEINTRDELHTAFGLYVLLHELTAGSRALVGGDKLLIGYHRSGGSHGLRPINPHHTSHLVRNQVRKWDLIRDDPDDGRPAPLLPTLGRLRLTYIELHQQPVAHTEQTAASTYLGRNRGNVTEYQKIVADALAEEAAKAHARRTVATMSATDVARAATDPQAVAAQQGLDPVTLQRMLAGKLDTVLAACTDYQNGPHTPGQPCRASFMLCLECECARALPRHLALQVLVHDKLAARRGQIDALRWAQRFATPYARLVNLLGQHDSAAVADARAHASPAEHALADRFLNRELDLR